MCDAVIGLAGGWGTPVALWLLLLLLLVGGLGTVLVGFGEFVDGVDASTGHDGFADETHC